MPQLKLIETFATGAEQVFPLHKLQNLKASAGAVYTVVDAETSAVPQGLRLKRKEDALEVEVDGEVVATLEGFYADNASASFRIGETEGATGTAVVIGAADVPQDDNSNIVWQAESASDDWGNWGWYAGGGALLAAGLAAAGGGGGGSDGDDSGTDTTPPTIVSPSNAQRVELSVTEDTDAGEVIYDIAVDEPATFSITGQDASSFAIEETEGNAAEVSLLVAPDFASQASYQFTVVAEDASGNVTEQFVTLTVGDPGDTTAPEIISGAVAVPIAEDAGSGQVIYQAEANEPVTFTLEGEDASSFTINSINGAVTLIEVPDFANQPSYEFTVVATDAAGNSSEQPVTLAVTDPNTDDTTAPNITSGAVAEPIDENSGEGQVIYTAEANEPVTYSLKTGLDASSFTINENNGEVTLTDSPDFESQQSYSFTVVATDNAGNSSEKTVSLAVNDIEEADPSVVVFDLTTGLSSDHSAQSFAPDIDYTIYVRVDSGDHNLNLAGGEAWSDAGNLTAADQVIFVGSGSDITGGGSAAVDGLRAGTNGSFMALIARTFPPEMDVDQATYFAVSLTDSGNLRRSEGSRFNPDTDSVDLWAGQAKLADGISQPSFDQNYLQTIPSGVTLPV